MQLYAISNNSKRYHHHLHQWLKWTRNKLLLCVRSLSFTTFPVSTSPKTLLLIVKQFQCQLKLLRTEPALCNLRTFRTCAIKLVAAPVHTCTYILSICVSLCVCVHVCMCVCVHVCITRYTAYTYTQKASHIFKSWLMLLLLWLLCKRRTVLQKNR